MAVALQEDPTAALFSNYITPEAQKAFNDARAVASGSSGSTESNKDKKRKPRKKFPGGRPPRGWKSGEAYFYFNEAQKDERDREWLACADDAQASLAAENRASTRYLAASCEERAGLWIEALADYRIVADTAGGSALYDVEGKAKSSVGQLTGKIPKVVIRKPAKATDLVVTMNDQPIDAEKLNGEIWVNPGQRTIAAHGKVDGTDQEFEQSVDLAEGETVTVDVKLQPKGVKGRDTQIMKCMLAATTREDFQKCLSSGAKGPSLNYHFGTEFSGYHDTDHVDVVTPAFFATVENPTGGWGVNASFLVDVVTAASVDVVSERLAALARGPLRADHRRPQEVRRRRRQHQRDDEPRARLPRARRRRRRLGRPPQQDDHAEPPLRLRLRHLRADPARRSRSTRTRSRATRIAAGVHLRPRQGDDLRRRASPPSSRTATPRSRIATSRCSTRRSSRADDPARARDRLGERDPLAGALARAAPDVAAALGDRGPPRAPLHLEHHPRRGAPLHRQLGPQGDDDRRAVPDRHHQGHPGLARGALPRPDGDELLAARLPGADRRRTASSRCPRSAPATASSRRSSRRRAASARASLSPRSGTGP